MRAVEAPAIAEILGTRSSFRGVRAARD